MSKKYKVYKVVNKSYDGYYTSAITNDEGAKKVGACLVYEPGKVTKPKFGKIFAFRRLRDALDFNKINRFPIFRAFTTAPPKSGKGNSIMFHWRVSSFKNYWEGRNTIDDNRDAPLGTVFCDDLTLEKEMKRPKVPLIK